MRHKFQLILLFLTATLFIGINPVHAQGITIGDGSELVLNNASLDLGCLNLTIENGGTFNLGSGIIRGLRNLIINSGGIFIQGTGKIYPCPGHLPAIFLLLLE